MEYCLMPQIQIDEGARTIGSSLLLSEISHRVANEYALAVSSISLAANRTSDPSARAALGHAIKRLLDYANTHRALQAPSPAQPADLSVYLQEVCKALVRSLLEERGVSLTIACEPIVVSADRCWRVGMIVFELITNSVRHAFAGGRGEIRVELTQSDGQVVCRVSDNGAAATTHAPGRGSEIVEALAEEVYGRISRVSRNDGTSVQLSFPIHTSLA
jgi:two-component sensor histidine kinase